MRLRLSLAGLVLLAGCSDWDRHRPPVAAPALPASNAFAEICARLASPVARHNAEEATFELLSKYTRSSGCDDAAENILALRDLDLSAETKNTYPLDLALIAKIEGLQSLNLSGHYLESLTPLSALKNLHALDVTNTGINQDLSQLDVASLPFKSLRHLRLTVKDETAARFALREQFRKNRREGETLVIASVERGRRTVALTLPTDAKDRDAVLEAWKTGQKSDASEELGTFVDYRSVSVQQPTLVYDRGYLLDIAFVPAQRDSEEAIAHLIAQWAGPLQGNHWTVTPDKIDDGNVRVLIEPSAKGAAADLGAVPLGATQPDSDEKTEDAPKTPATKLPSAVPTTGPMPPSAGPTAVEEE